MKKACHFIHLYSLLFLDVFLPLLMMKGNKKKISEKGSEQQYQCKQ